MTRPEHPCMPADPLCRSTDVPQSISAWSTTPVAEELTAALIAPRGYPVLTEADRGELRTRLLWCLERRADLLGEALTRITPFALRQRFFGRAVTPFRWSPWTARRTIGIAAVRVCTTGALYAPADAVATVVAEMAGRGGPPGSLGTWLSRAAAPVVALVRAEATTWASNLLSAVDWSRPGLRPVIGAPDRWWCSPTMPRVAIRGRVDLSVTSAGNGNPRGPRAVLTVFEGCPSPASRVELGLAPLVSALTGPLEDVPVRAAGWWPAAGRLLTFPVGPSLLADAADAVAQALGPPCPPVPVPPAPVMRPV
jgi:hypothetical protein